LNDSELLSLVNEGKQKVYGLIDLAAEGYRHHATKKDRMVCTKILEGTGVLQVSREQPSQEQSIKVVILDSLMRPPRIPINGETHGTNGAGKQLPSNGDTVS